MSSALPYVFAAGTVASTLIGGGATLRFPSRLPLFMGFAAGVILGVVSFEIFPEIMAQVRDHGADPTRVMLCFAVGFLLFHALEKALLLHHCHEGQFAPHKHPHVGMLSASVLGGHSFLDGVGIALGFAASRSAGIAVALAVIAHDFTDGMNTVSLMLMHKNTPARARLFLLADALAPVAGIAVVRMLTIPEGALTLYLGFFAGFLLYIGAADVLPEAHHEQSSVLTVVMTVLGVAFAFAISRVA